MISTLSPPVIRDWGPITPAFGGALPPSGALPASLREVLHPSVRQALEGIWDEIESQTLTPLFLAEPREGLAQTFLLVRPRFAAYYLGATLTLVASIQEPKLLSEIVAFGFDAIRDTLRAKAIEHLGREARVAALTGMHCMTRILKASALQTADEPEQRRLEALMPQLMATASSYWLAIFGVFYALFQGEAFAGRRENVATLAHWSQGYAAQVYDLSSRHGLLRLPMRPPGAVPVRSTDEDLQLADAGLEDYARFLKEGDEQTKGPSRRIRM